MNTTLKDEKTVTIEIFDPPMCCPSGLCGPDIDPALLDINEAVLKVKKEFDGQVKVERYLLSQQGPKFMQQPEVMKRLQTNGVEILPLTLVDGKVMKEKEYPVYDELINYVKERQ
ncbi:MAG: arsenite efflux transporter metallochaperone ArsD [Melioribacteraceae bacterium]|nr:arsenite efflux transporter metallochaperone ArsD [Melioribacteraceae bacterium]